MNPHPFDFDTDEKLAERHAADMNKTAVYNTDPSIWEEAAKRVPCAARRRADDQGAIRFLHSKIEQVAQRVVLPGGSVQRCEDFRLRLQNQPPALAVPRHPLVRDLNGILRPQFKTSRAPAAYAHRPSQVFQ